MGSRMQTMRRWVLAEPLVAKPGQKSEYSDLGYLLLQWIVEVVSGQSLDRYIPISTRDLMTKAPPTTACAAFPAETLGERCATA